MDKQWMKVVGTVDLICANVWHIRYKIKVMFFIRYSYVILRKWNEIQSVRSVECPRDFVFVTEINR